MRVNISIKFAVVFVCIGVLTGCLESASAPVQPSPKPTDSTQTSGPALPDTITRTWIMPYPRGTPDSDLVGDFAPVAVGNTWIYYQSRIRIPRLKPDEDTEWIARVDVRIISVESSDTGRLVHLRVAETPLATRCMLTASGKTWRWDEVPRESAMTAEKVFLEKGDGFFQLGADGKWHMPAPSYGLLFHRFQRYDTSPQTGSPWMDTLAIQEQPSRYYLKDVGLVEMDSSGDKANAIHTLIKLVSFNGRIFLDSLNMELTRPLIPKDSLTGKITLEEVKASLPNDYCSEPGPSGVEDPNQALYDWVDIKPGTTWEYLSTESESSTGSWYASSSELYQGLSRITVTGTLASGICTFFGYQETDSLFHGESSNSDPYKTTKEGLPPRVSSVLVLGVKRGDGIYRWSMTGNTFSLDSLKTGLAENGVLWPFASGLAGIAEGAKDSTYPIIRSLADSDVGTMHSLVYSYKAQRDGPLPGIEFKFVKNLGVAYSGLKIYWLPGNEPRLWTRELFRQNGIVIDTSVLARYQAIIPTHP